MNNINISVLNNTLTWPQNEPLDRYEIQNQLGINATDTNGNNLNQYITLDLSRINVYQPGTYHGSINVSDPNTSTTNFMNFNITILPTGPQPVREPQENQQTKRPKKSNKKKKIIIICLAILAIILLVTACHHHSKQQAQQARTEQQIKNNRNGVKSNAAANADMQKQIDQLKDAQAKYNQDHDKQAYQDRVAQLEDQNQKLQNQVHDADMAKKVQDFGNSLTSAANDPNSQSGNAQNIAQQSGFSGLWSKIQAMFYNWLNS